MSIQDAITSLENVGKNARLYCSMPVVEGVTPIALLESEKSEEIKRILEGIKDERQLATSLIEVITT